MVRIVKVAVVVLLVVTAACTSGGGDNNGDARVAEGSKAKSAADCRTLSPLIQRVRRGYVGGAAPDLLYIPHAPNYVGVPFRPTHSGPWPYVNRVPLVFYGPPFVRDEGEIDVPATMADIAPTIARLVAFTRWPERDGHVLGEGLNLRRRPRLVVTIVWDGGGWDVLEEHRNRWPFLASLMKRGLSYPKMTVGSSPSVTPPVHATLGTGSWPYRHGIHAIQHRMEGGDLSDPLLNLDPTAIRLPTLADLYDRRRGNEPITAMLASSNWHLGMIGHGASLPGGDSDPVVLIDEDGFTYSNEKLYSLAPIADRSRLLRLLDRLDVSDGKADGAWNGDDLFGDDSLKDVLTKKGNPARVKYEEWLLERLVRSENLGGDTVPDLLFVNFKAADEAGHRWGMSSDQVGAVVAEQDRALRGFVSFLNRVVGRKRWVLMVTADHGQTPLPQDSGAWPISASELVSDGNREFDQVNNGTPLVVDALPAGVYLDKVEMKSGGVTQQEIARWLSSYTAGQNAAGSLRGDWKGREDELLFDAVLIGRHVVRRNC